MQPKNVRMSCKHANIRCSDSVPQFCGKNSNKMTMRFFRLLFRNTYKNLFIYFSVGFIAYPNHVHVIGSVKVLYLP